MPMRGSEVAREETRNQGLFWPEDQQGKSLIEWSTSSIIACGQYPIGLHPVVKINRQTFILI